MKENELKVVFLGFNHREKDSRLFYREMTSVKENIPSVCLFFAKAGQVVPAGGAEDTQCFTGTHSESSVFARLRIKAVKMARAIPDSVRILWKLRNIKPDVIQASDAKEIPFALVAKLCIGGSVIYDSHEDYVRQAIDCSKIRAVGWYRAAFVYFYELVGVRFFDSVFCTDDYLCKKYRSNLYQARQVFLLRNFPPVAHLKQKIANDKFVDSNYSLNLVYIGGVNRIKGVVEAAEFVKRFNEEASAGHRISFTLYSPMNTLVENLIADHDIYWHDWINFVELNEKIRRYDVGVCLWTNVPKLVRNLPLKNFDYMAAGLPILTSNFGNLYKYAEESRAALCIDPSSYEGFRLAIHRLMDEGFRRHLSQAGRKYVLNQANFESEAGNYLRFFQDVARRKRV